MDGKHQEWVTFLEYFMHTFFSDPGATAEIFTSPTDRQLLTSRPTSPRARWIQRASRSPPSTKFVFGSMYHSISHHFPPLKKKPHGQVSSLPWHFFWYVCRIPWYLFVIVHFLMVALWSLKHVQLPVSKFPLIERFQYISIYINLWPPPCFFFFEGWISPKLKEFVFQFPSSKPHRPNRLRVHESLHEIQPDGRKKGSFWPFGLQ